MTTFARSPHSAPLHVARRGLTLIEVLIVIAILLAIGGLVVVNILPQRDKADKDLTSVQIENLVGAMKMFKLNMKRFPTEDEGLAALWNRDAIEDEEEAESWQGPYLEDPLPRDTWNNEWVYRPESEIAGTAYYDIISMGPDGEEGTDDDIHNHMEKVGADGELNEEFEDMTMPDEGLE